MKDNDVEDRDDWPTDVNVHRVERKASRIAGVAVLALAALRRGIVGTGLGVLGAALMHRGMTGHCRVYSALRISTAHGRRGPNASVPHGQGVRIRRSMVIARAPAQVYAFWRKLANLPIVLHGVDEVIELSDGRSHWRGRGPLGASVEWEATLVNDIDGELIAWRSLEGSRFVGHAGSVRFAPAINGTGTLVSVTMEYAPPAGLIGTFVAKMLGTDPDREVENGLRRLKMLLESSEVTELGDVREVGAEDVARDETPGVH